MEVDGGSRPDRAGTLLRPARAAGQIRRPPPLSPRPPAARRAGSSGGPALPSPRRRGKLAFMAKPLAKLVSLLKPKRRWAQFRLRSLFVLMAVLAVPCGW